MYIYNYIFFFLGGVYAHIISHSAHPSFGKSFKPSTFRIWVQLAWRDACLEIAPANVRVGDVGLHDLWESIWCSLNAYSTICARKFFISANMMCQYLPLGGTRMKFQDNHQPNPSIHSCMFLGYLRFSGVHDSTFGMRWNLTLPWSLHLLKKCLLTEEG